MVSVQFLRNQQRNFLKKGQGGYISDEEFNDALKSAENTLFEYYYKIFEETQKVVDALVPFIKRQEITLTNGISDLPTDYRHRLAVEYRWVDATCGKIKIEDIPVDYVMVNEVPFLKSNPIRRPNIARKKIRHTFFDNKIEVLPSTVQKVTMTYLRSPIHGFYASDVVLSPGGAFEQFDPTLSRDSEFREQESEQLMDLLLFYGGISIRDSEVINFAAAKQKERLIG